MNKPFTVVWKNPEAPIPSPGRELVPCGVCGKKIHPFDALGFYQLAIRPGDYSGYEHPFYVCSEDCDNKKAPYMKKKVKELT